MHRDLDSSDAVPWKGPNPAGKLTSSVPLGTCSTTFQASDSMILALCTRYLGTQQGGPNPAVDAARAASSKTGVPQIPENFGLGVVVPSIMLFHPESAQPLATLELKKNSLLGGVYGYLDRNDRVVIAEGNNVLKVGHRFEGGRWRLSVDKRVPLNLPAGTSLAGLSPDGQGRTWFVTHDSRVGLIDGDRTVTHPLSRAPGGETIANGLTGRPNGVSVLTSHALNEVAYESGKIVVKWRRDYDRGSARKPGQLSWGSGTTPTVFGPGGKWVAIVDNADRSPNLMVLDAATGKDVCRMPAFTTGGPGTENSIMASGSTLWIPSTYGFQYPPFAVEGRAKPDFAPFTGGLARVDVVADKTGVHCERRWEKPVKIETLPILTEKDRRIWALSTDPRTLRVDLIGVNADTGAEVVRRQVGTKPVDMPMQLTGMITPDGAYWQGTLGRMLRLK